MVPLSLPSSLKLFYELVQKLNSTLDLDIVLAQVIEQVNQFLDIDATSVSLLDPESKELIIQMTIGKETDPRLGTRLPPFAGIAGWVVHHGEAVLIADVQKDPRFYPAVDQLTHFISRAMICVPLISKDHPIGVIQAISKSANVFSHADLLFMDSIAEVAALHIENARLYKREQEARRIAEVLKEVAEMACLPLDLEHMLELAMQKIQQVIAYDSMAVFTSQNYPSRVNHRLIRTQGRRECLLVIAEYGFDDPDTVHNLAVPIADAVLFKQMSLHKQPIAIADTGQDRRYVRWAGAQGVRSWLGVPLMSKGEVIGQISMDRNQVREFTVQEIDVAVAFAQQVASIIVNARLYDEALDRADDLAILNEIALAMSMCWDLESLLDRTLDSVLALFNFGAAGIWLLETSGQCLDLRAQRGFEPDDLANLRSIPVQDSSPCGRAILEHKTTVAPCPARKARETAAQLPNICIWVPLLVNNVAIGALAVLTRGRHNLSIHFLSLLEAIGQQIGIAINHTRAHAQKERP